MLANGATLGFSATASPTTYTNLTGLKEIPEMGNELEKVENTCLSDSSKQYEFGIGDYGDLEFKFKYDNSSATAPYRVMKGYEDSRTKLYFCLTYPDGTKFAWAAQVFTKLSGGSVNGALEFSLKMALQSNITPTNPA
jgi:hypothetical protein